MGKDKQYLIQIVEECQVWVGESKPGGRHDKLHNQPEANLQREKKL